MENNLDRYFREKLHDREFDMKDAYWKGAEQLLDADRRNRRRWLVGWGGPALLVLLTAMAAWWMWNQTTEVQTSAYLQQGREEGHPTGDGITAFSGTEQASVKDGEPGNEGQDLPAPGTLAGQEGKSGDPEKRPSEQTFLTEKTIDHQFFIKENTLPLPKGSGGVPPASTNENTKSETTPPASGAITVPVAESTPLVLPGEPVYVKPEPVENDATTFERELMSGLDLLEVRQIFVDGIVFKDLTVKEIDVKRRLDSPLSVGVAASQLFLPGGPDLIGWRAGLVVQYELRNGWFLASGLQYQRRTGTFESSKIAESRRYRFGLEADTQHLRPSSLHYVNLPLMAGWRKGRHVLEGGAGLGYLAGLRGEKGSFVKKGEPPVKVFQADKKGWLVTDGYKPLTVNVLLSYRFRVNRQWSFGLSADYTFGGILDENYNPPAGGYLLKEDHPLSFGLQAVYLIK